MLLDHMRIGVSPLRPGFDSKTNEHDEISRAN